MRTLQIWSLIFLTGIGLGSCSRTAVKAPEEPFAEFRLVNLHYENSGGEKGITHFYYDPDELNYMAVWHLADSTRSSLNHHVFDSSGRIILKSREFSDSITSVQHFYYDPAGNLSAEDFSRSDSVKGKVDYVYGEDGRIMYANCLGLNGWFYGRLVYSWEGEIKTGADIVRDSASIGKVTYEYDDGRLVYEEWDFNGEWSQVFRYEYQKSNPMTCTSSNVFIRESPWFRIYPDLLF